MGMEYFLYCFLGLVFFMHNKPMFLAVLFLSMLVLVVIMSSMKSAFLGLLVFIIYVGGLMVLFVYVFATVPKPGSNHARIHLWPVSVIMLSSLFGTFFSMNMYEVYDMVGLLILIGIILFLVMLSTVAMVDPHKGALKVDAYGFTKHD